MAAKDDREQFVKATELNRREDLLTSRPHHVHDVEQSDDDVDDHQHVRLTSYYHRLDYFSHTVVYHILSTTLSNNCPQSIINFQSLQINSSGHSTVYVSFLANRLSV